MLSIFVFRFVVNNKIKIIKYFYQKITPFFHDFTPNKKGSDVQGVRTYKKYVRPTRVISNSGSRKKFSFGIHSNNIKPALHHSCGYLIPFSYIVK